MSFNVLISVWDKTNLEDLSKKLSQKGASFIATGSTAKFLKKQGHEVIKVSDLTGFPEILDGRVKTLHPKVFGGILYNRKKQEHLSEIKDHNISSIDMVVCNLYPFEESISKGLNMDEMIEYIDIGGVTLLRASAKASIPVLCDVEDYYEYIKRLDENKIDENYIFDMKIKVFNLTSNYDRNIGDYFSKQTLLKKEYTYKKELRYGENPHQKASIYRDNSSEVSICDLPQLQGKELSYNNYLDLDTAISIVKEFMDKKACAILKHGNSCGLAQGSEIYEVYEKALAGDPLSAYGGIVCVNYEIDERLAKRMNEHFFEIIIASSYSESARSIFKKKKNLRVIEYKNFDKKNSKAYVSLEGALLVQDKDWYKEDFEMKVVTKNKPDENDLKQLEFAFKCVKNVKSNAIVITKDNSLIGMGAGQPSRVDSVYLAVRKAGDKVKGAYLASDAFFPFSDGIEKAHESGIKAIIQPGGSIRDKKVIEKADELGIIMVMTGKRHFRH